MSADVKEDKQPETELAHLRIITEKPYLKAAIDLVTDIAQSGGIGVKDSRNLDKVLAEIFENIVKYGFGEDRCKPIEVILSRRLHSLVVAVEDKGLPFDYDKLECGEEKRFEAYISKHYADEVNFGSLGARGNRTEIVKNLPASDIREEMDISVHHAHIKAKEAPPDEEITVGMLDSSKIRELVRLVYKCYGYTYANEFMYYPEQIKARLDSGIMLSAAAYNSRNEIIGHVGFIFSTPGARVAESGEAVVDPRYRGRGIFQKLKNYLIGRVSPMDVVGIYGEAVTVHPYSQKGSIELGGRETGFLLGYSPGTVSFQNISENEKPRRQSVAMMFTPISDSGPETSHVPHDYKDLIAAVYDRIGFGRRLTPEDEESGVGGRQKGRTNVSIRHDHNQALIVIERVGKMTLKEIRFQLNHLRLGHFDCIYVDLPLKQKGAGYIASELRKLGFFFGCVIPHLRDGDILRLQYLNNIEILRDDIKTASDFGERLLGAILNDMEEVSS